MKPRRLLLATIGIVAAVSGLGFPALGLSGPVAMAQQPPISTLDTVKARGILIAGLKNDFPPAGYIDADGKWIGFEVDLAQYVADKLGVKLQREAVTSRTRIPMLINGNIDLILATLGPTRERAQVIDFTIPYWSGGLRVMTRKDSGIHGVMDLAGRKTGMAQGSSDAQMVLAHQPKADIVYFQEWPLAALALRQGKVEAIATTDYTLPWLAKGDDNLVVVGPIFQPDIPVIGVRQNDSKWRLFLDQMIGEAWADGTIAKLYEKYVGGKPGFTLPVWRDYLVTPQ